VLNVRHEFAENSPPNEPARAWLTSIPCPAAPRAPSCRPRMAHVRDAARGLGERRRRTRPGSHRLPSGRSRPIPSPSTRVPAARHGRRCSGPRGGARLLSTAQSHHVRRPRHRPPRRACPWWRDFSVAGDRARLGWVWSPPSPALNRPTPRPHSRNGTGDGDDEREEWP
jgi:hypothetical protein